MATMLRWLKGRSFSTIQIFYYKARAIPIGFQKGSEALETRSFFFIVVALSCLSVNRNRGRKIETFCRKMNNHNFNTMNDFNMNNHGQGDQAWNGSTANPNANVGGHAEVPTDDAEVNSLLKSNLAHLVAGDGTPFELVSITKITKQVVAGLKYTITGVFKKAGANTECTCSLWHRAWLDDPKEKTKLKIDCGGEVVYPKGDDGAW